MRSTSFLAVCAMTLILCAATAWGQQQDVLKVNYFDNANTTGAPDATLRLSNPGTYGGSLCAGIFVFDPMQELSECCSCLLTPNGLRKLSVNNDLTANPLTGIILTSGMIEVVSTAPVSGKCPAPTNMNPVATLRAWGTHIQDGSFTLTETISQDATLSNWEKTQLDEECRAIRIGSGGGNCTCGTGD